MINICSQCGLYRADKITEKGAVICPDCQHRHSFTFLPLFIICGPSCAGKTTVCEQLVGKLASVVVLDGDILWRDEFISAENPTAFFDTWLRVAKNINQSGRPVVLFSSGAIPPNVEPCIERRYFSDVHYLALICDPDTHVARLKARPEWRGTGTPEFIESQANFNRWFIENAKKANPAIDLIDTSLDSVDTTTAKVTSWIQSKL